MKETPNFRQGGKEEACKEDQFESLCFDLWHPFLRIAGVLFFPVVLATVPRAGFLFSFCFQSFICNCVKIDGRCPRGAQNRSIPEQSPPISVFLRWNHFFYSPRNSEHSLARPVVVLLVYDFVRLTLRISCNLFSVFFF